MKVHNPTKSERVLLGPKGKIVLVPGVNEVDPEVLESALAANPKARTAFDATFILEPEPVHAPKKIQEPKKAKKSKAPEPLTYEEFVTEIEADHGDNRS
jgi:hypothetical protein